MGRGREKCWERSAYYFLSNQVSFQNVSQLKRSQQVEVPLNKCTIKCLYLYTARSRMIWLRFSSSFKEKSSLRNNPFWEKEERKKKMTSLAILYR